MNSPSLRSAAAMGVRAAAHESWLLPVGGLVAVVRSASAVPAVAAAVALVSAGAERSARLSPSSLTAALEGGAAVLVSPRFHAIVGGLWLAGALLAGILRTCFLAGALPTLGARIAGVDPTRRFAPGVAWGLPRQLATWLLAGAAELAAAGYLLAVLLAAGWIAAHPGQAGSPLLLATVGGAAFSIGLAGLLASRVIGDAAAARTAILGEGPVGALAGATRRLLARPGAFLLGGVAATLAGAVAWGALQPVAGVAAAVREQVDGTVAMGPELMLALLTVLAAAAIDLAWLSTVGTLACAGEAPRRDEDRVRPVSA